MYRKTLLDKMERKLGRFAIPRLMFIIVIITAMVWLVDTLVWYRAEATILGWLYFDRDLIMQGEVWRVITFLFIPDEWNLAWFIISSYFYCIIGNALEDEWSSFRFGIFYLCGWLGSVASGFILGYTTNIYINLTIFLAFAIVNPNYQLLLFFFFPVKAKYLAMIDGLILILEFIIGTWYSRLALIFAIANIVLFFWRDLTYTMRGWRRSYKYKKQREKEEREFVFPEQAAQREVERREKENKRKMKEKKDKDDDFPFDL